MEKEDDLDSLFAGMEFVNPLDAESPLFPKQSSNFPSEFSDPVPNSKDLPILTSDTKIEGLDGATISGIDNILAAYDKTSGKMQPSLVSLPSFHKQSSDKHGARRKRRTVKIGYGRSTADDTDEVRAVSGQDETGSNGSALDERNTGSSEIFTADDMALDAGHKALHTSVANESDHLTSCGVFEKSHEEPYEDLPVSADRLDTADAQLAVLEDNVLHVLSLSAKTLHADGADLKSSNGCLIEKEAEFGDLAAVTKESAENFSLLQPTIPEALSNTHEISHEKDVTITENPSQVLDVTSNLQIHLPIHIPLDLSLNERLSFINTTVAKNANCIHKKMAVISQLRKEAAQKRRHMTEAVSNMSIKFKEVEEEMQAACEREDFEKAEQLDADLVFAQKAKEAATEAFIAFEAEYDKYASEMLEIIQLFVENDEEGLLLLEQLAQEATETATQMEKDSGDDVKIRADELLACEASLKSEKEKLMQEVQKVEGEKMDLTCRIEASVLKESKEKEQLSEEREVLLQELDTLLTSVRLKECEIAKHEKKLGDLEQTINNRVTGFQEERLELETKFQELESGLNNLEKDLEDLSKKRNHLEAEGICSQKSAETILELSSIAKTEALKLKDVLSVRKAAAKVALSSKEKRFSLATQEKQHVEDANSLRARSSSMRTLLQELASNKLKLQQEVISANQQISLIEKRLPEIEAEKKLAAGSRNFKEAGRLAAEAKALLSDMERIVAKSKKFTQDFQVMEQELESHARDLTELEGQLQLKEEEAAKARYERLRLLAAVTREERDAALELEDPEEANSLDVEAAVADKEADEILKEFKFDGGSIE